LATYVEPANRDSHRGPRESADRLFFATHRGKKENDFNVHYNASGAFHDQLIRTSEGWRIQVRRLQIYFGDPLQIAKIG
jgi:hypothetical protein